MSPLLIQDPVYIDLVTNGGVEEIISQKVRDNGYTVTTLPVEYEKRIILESKREIYLRLATNTAPEFDMEERYTKILRGQRFDHYIKLWDAVNKEIQYIDKNERELTQGELVLRNRDGSLRNYNLSSEFPFTAKVEATTSTTVDLSWDMFDATKQGFDAYKVFVGNVPIYDEYYTEYTSSYVGIETINKGIDTTKLLAFYLLQDIKRTKFRVKGLTPSTKYYIVVRAISSNGSIATQELTATTGS